MSRTSSERLALAAALAASVAGGCARQDIDVTPFALSVVALEGAPPLEPPAGSSDAIVTLLGVAARESDTALRLVSADPAYTVRFSFSNEASRDVAFPDRLDGATVVVHLRVRPGTVAPDGTPIPFPAVRIAIGTPAAGRYQFVLGESPVTTDDVAGIPRPLLPQNPPYVLPEFALPPFEDFPFFEVFADLVYFEPANCGLQYYDVLRVRRFPEDSALSMLRSGESLEMAVPESDSEPWTVRHVLSWHRVGSCGSEPRAWTQLAAWRK